MCESATISFRQSGRSGDAEIISHADSNTFENIYRIYGRRVRNLCRRMLKDPIQAEDTAQEVFLRVFLKLHTFRGESAFSSWLYRLTMNQIFMWFRKNCRQHVSIDAFQAKDTDLQYEVGSPDLQLSGMPERIDLQNAINGLPHGYREVFILYEIQGFKHKEIASILGYSVGSSKSQLHKARKCLRARLEVRHLGSPC